MDDSVQTRGPRLKLALYHPWIYLHGGIERSILQLATRSRHQWTIFTGHYDAAGTFPELAALDVRVLNPTSTSRGLGDVFKSAVQVARQKLPLDADTDAVLVCCDGIGDLVTLRNHAVPVFNLCFTPLRPVFDPAYDAQALSKRGPLQRSLYALFREAFRWIDRRAWRHYRGVLPISAEVKRRILAGGLYRDHNMALAHPGVDWSPQAPEVEYEKFILLSGRIMWTKNIELAIRAFAQARLPSPWRLVIAGFVDRKSAPYLAALQEIAAGAPNIEFVVSPSDGVLDDLLRRASFCLFSAFNEDWGLVPLEAMAHAKAVIAVDAGGPRETIAHGHTGYLLPLEVADWASCIAMLAADPDLVRKLGEQGHAHCCQFTWDRFISMVDDTLADWVTRTGHVPAVPPHAHAVPQRAELS